MNWELFWRYVLDFAVLYPAVLAALAPVRTFLHKPRRLFGKLLLFVTLAVFGAASVCTLLRLQSNMLLLPGVVAAFWLYFRAVREVLNAWKAAFGLLSSVFLQAICATEAVLLCARSESVNTATVCMPVTGLVCLGLSAVISVLYSFTASRWIAWLLREYEGERIWRTVWLLPAIYTALYMFSMPRDTSIVLHGRVQGISVLTGLLPLGVYFLFVYQLYSIGREAVRNHQLTEENHVLALESHRYAELRAYMDKTRILRHDFRQHLRVIAGLSEAGQLDELRAYLKQYTCELSEQTATLCANAAADAIAGYYDAAARRMGLQIAWRLELPQKLPLPEADFCMMLGNLLENALRALAALPPAERMLHVICQMISPGMLGLIVENRYDGVLRRRGDLLLSTHHQGHGTGLLSVRTIVHRYHGTLTLETDGGVFRVSILLNV